MKVRVLTLSALMAAFSAGTVFLGVLFPVMDLSFTAMAGVFPAVATLKGGLRAGVMTWLAGSLLCFLLAAAQPAGVMFACLFGVYPVVKAVCEKARRPWAARAGKFLFANLGGGAVAALYALFFPGLLKGVGGLVPDALFLGNSSSFLSIALFLMLFWAAFVLYDIALSRILLLIQKRIPFRRAGE